MKTYICMIAGSLGAVVAQVFGGWSDCITVLLILMAIDYISGLVVAGVFHKSPKTETGALESRVGLKGLIRKFFIVAIVVVAHMIDRLIGTNYLRDAAAIAFCLNEVISIIENAGLMGTPMPKVIIKALEVLRQKAGEDSPSPSGSPLGEGVSAAEGKSAETDFSAAPRNDNKGDGSFDSAQDEKNGNAGGQ